MKELFLLSGLGADQRVYDFVDLSDHHVHHIHWISPFSNEKLQQYARRLCQQITSANPVVIGVSFGGIMAMEIGKIIDTEKIILISSARTKRDIPLNFKITGKLRLHRTMPSSFMKSNNPVTSWLFGARTPKEKALLTTILQETNSEFLNWAIDKLVGWNNTDPLQNVIQIHGTSDKILPYTKANYTIKGGEHLMIVNRADEVSMAIKEALRI